MGGVDATNKAMSKPKAKHWLDRLSGINLMRVKARIEADGYDGDAEGWLADMLTTACRSPQGFVLRFSTTKPERSRSLTAVEGELFALPEGGGE